MRRVLIAGLLCTTCATGDEPSGQSNGVLVAPLLEYRFEEGAGVAIANSGSHPGADGTRRDGLGTGGAIFSADTPSAFSSSSLLFDGVNDWVSIPDEFDYTGLSQLTIETWIKPSDVSGQRVVWDDFGNPGVVFAVYQGGVQFDVSTASHPGPGVSLISGSVVAGVWQHIAGVYDGSTLRIYINGVDTCARVATAGEIQDNSTINPGSAPIGIGADSVTIPALNFAGAIDELRVHGEALDSDAIASGQFSGLPDPCAGDDDDRDDDDGGDDDGDRIDDRDGDDDDEDDGDDRDDDGGVHDNDDVTVTIAASNVSTLSGGEALAADATCRLFVKSLQDPAGTPVQLSAVIGGGSTVLGTHSSIRSSDVSGIAVDPMTGHLLVTDEIGGSGGRIVLIDPVTQEMSVLFDVPWLLNPASNGTGQQQFAPDPEAPVLYFWDSTRSAVFKLNRFTGALSTLLAVDQETAAGQHVVSYVNDVIFDPFTRTILLADNTSGRVLEIDPGRTPATVTTLFAGISMPHALALSADGSEVYVGSGFQSVLVGSRAGGRLSSLATGFTFVTDIVACGGSVWAVDKSLDTVFEIHD